MNPPGRLRRGASRARVAALEALIERRPIVGAGDEAGPVSDSRTTAWRDRALAEQLRRGVLQNLTLLDYYLKREGEVRLGRTPPALRWVLRLAAYQRLFLRSVPPYAIGQEAVALARTVGGERGARFVNAVVRRMLGRLPVGERAIAEDLASQETGPLDPSIRYSMPRAIIRALAEGYGEAAVPSLLQAFNEPRTPVWLRVNRLRAESATLIQRLADEGCRVERWEGLEGVLRWVPPSRAPWETEPWRRGELTVQDLGAMLGGWLLAPSPGDRVLDACAAPGGKTGQLWELMAGSGELVASEPDPARRQRLGQTLERLYGPNLPLRVAAPENLKRDRPDEVESHRFTHILLDVPCLGFGLLRRHPEARWDGRWRRVDSIVTRQKRILAEAAPRLAPGGRLLWMTCSPTRWENEEVAGEWVQRHPEFAWVDPTPRIPSAAREWTQIDGPFVRTRPDRAPVDGFALALIKRA